MRSGPGSTLRYALLALGAYVAVWQAGLAQPSLEAAEKLRRANALVQADKPEQAIPIYRELVAAFPNEPTWRINLAVALYKAGHYAEVADLCRALAERRPDDFRAWLFLGASQLKLGQSGGAVGALRKATALQPGDVNARLMLADGLLDQREFKEAAAEYAAAQKTVPENPRVWHGLGRSYEGEAADNLERLEKSAPGSAEFLALAGDFELQRGQSARALKNYRAALALKPDLPGLHNAIAAIYTQTGHADWAATVRAHEQTQVFACTADTPFCAFISGRLQDAASAPAATPGDTYWQAKACQELARRAYARLRELPPSRERAVAAAEADEKGGRYKEAAAAWREALQFTKNDAGLERRLALALCHSNDCATAQPMLRALLERDRASAELHYLYGLALLETHEPEQAIRYLESALQLDPGFRPAHGALGEAYLEAGRWEQAIPQLEVALAEDDAGTRHYQLARAYQGAGQPERAAAALKEYRAILARREAEERDEPRITPP